MYIYIFTYIYKYIHMQLTEALDDLRLVHKICCDLHTPHSHNIFERLCVCDGVCVRAHNYFRVFVRER